MLGGVVLHQFVRLCGVDCGKVNAFGHVSFAVIGLLCRYFVFEFNLFASFCTFLGNGSGKSKLKSNRGCCVGGNGNFTVVCRTDLNFVIANICRPCNVVRNIVYGDCGFTCKCLGYIDIFVSVQHLYVICSRFEICFFVIVGCVARRKRNGETHYKNQQNQS